MVYHSAINERYSFASLLLFPPRLRRWNKTATILRSTRDWKAKASTRSDVGCSTERLWSHFLPCIAPRNFARLLGSRSRRLTRNLMIAERRYPKGNGTKLAAASRRTSIWVRSSRAEPRRRPPPAFMVGRVSSDFFRVQIPRPSPRNPTQRTNAPHASWPQPVAPGSDRLGSTRKVKVWRGTRLSPSYTMKYGKL